MLAWILYGFLEICESKSINLHPSCKVKLLLFRFYDDDNEEENKSLELAI